MKVTTGTGMVHLTFMLLLTILQSSSLIFVDSFAPVVASPLINHHRGGATTLPSNPSHAHTPDSDGSSDSDAEVEVEVDLVTSKFANVAANNAKQMSNSGLTEMDRLQQSKSLLLSAILWSSLALDTVLNKKKRCQIFPGLEAAGNGGALMFQFGQRNVNLASTAMMTSGFLLSAGLAYFLSTDYKRDDSADETGVRKKLSLLLFSFGTINLCGNISPERAPFYGMGGFIINAHNALIALNGWIKEMRADSSYSNSPEEGNEPTMKDFGNTIKSMISPISRPIGASLSGMGAMAASLMRVCGIIAFMRAFGVVTNYLLPHYKLFLATKSVRLFFMRWICRILVRESFPVFSCVRCSVVCVLINFYTFHLSTVCICSIGTAPVDWIAMGVIV